MTKKYKALSSNNRRKVTTPTRLLLCVSIQLLLTACATSIKPTIDSLVINNTTNHHVEDVTLQILDTNQVFSCSVILPKSFCSIDFPARENKNQKATLSWIQHNQFYIKTLRGDSVNDDLNIDAKGAIVNIGEYGELKVHLE